MAIVAAPCARAAVQHAHHVRRTTRLRDADDQRPLQARRDAVHGGEGRCRERHRQAVERPEQVLGIDRGVVGAAARRDEHEVDVPARERLGDRLDGRALAGQQPPGDLGLLQDLVPQAHGHSSRCMTRRPLHRAYRDRPGASARGTRPAASISPKMTAAMASRRRVVDGVARERGRQVVEQRPHRVGIRSATRTPGASLCRRPGEPAPAGPGAGTRRWCTG